MSNKINPSSYLLYLYSLKTDNKEFNPRIHKLNSIRDAKDCLRAITELFSSYKINQAVIDYARGIFNKADEDSIWAGLSMSLVSSEDAIQLKKLAESVINNAENQLNTARLERKQKKEEQKTVKK